MINIQFPVGNQRDNNPDDVRSVRKALEDYGSILPNDYEREPDGKPLGLITRRLDQGIKDFQKDNNLRIDGFLAPQGETIQKIREKEEEENSPKILDINGRKVHRDAIFKAFQRVQKASSDQNEEDQPAPQDTIEEKTPPLPENKPNPPEEETPPKPERKPGPCALESRHLKQATTDLKNAHSKLRSAELDRDQIKKTLSQLQNDLRETNADNDEQSSIARDVADDAGQRIGKKIEKKLPKIALKAGSGLYGLAGSIVVDIISKMNDNKNTKHIQKLIEETHTELVTIEEKINKILSPAHDIAQKEFNEASETYSNCLSQNSPDDTKQD